MQNYLSCSHRMSKHARAPLLLHLHTHALREADHRGVVACLLPAESPQRGLRGVLHALKGQSTPKPFAYPNSLRQFWRSVLQALWQSCSAGLAGCVRSRARTDPTASHHPFLRQVIPTVCSSLSVLIYFSPLELSHVLPPLIHPISLPFCERL